MPIKYLRLLISTISITAYSVAFPSQATGFNFWESSALNSSLANANGAKARDASVQAMVPASITQLDKPMITANLTYYQVDTDYNIFGTATHYSVANPIPSGFYSTPIDEHWSLGLGIYSRAAADINVPSITLVHPNETRAQPITVSISPTIAYKLGDLSFALTGEYLLAQHQLIETRCRFNNCITDVEKGDTSGISGALSATWQVNNGVYFSFSHRFDAQFSNADIKYSLPSISSFYSTVSLTSYLQWDINYSLSRWEEEGIFFSNYSDPLGLFIGAQNSQRIATGLEYNLNDWFFRAGYSADEAIDALGGIDNRYRIGVGYQISPNIDINFAAIKEYYAIKEYNTNDIQLVNVKNTGRGFTLGINYQFD